MKTFGTVQWLFQMEEFWEGNKNFTFLELETSMSQLTTWKEN